MLEVLGQHEQLSQHDSSCQAVAEGYMQTTVDGFLLRFDRETHRGRGPSGTKPGACLAQGALFCINCHMGMHCLRCVCKRHGAEEPGKALQKGADQVRAGGHEQTPGRERPERQICQRLQARSQKRLRLQEASPGKVLTFRAAESGSIDTSL